MTPFHELRRFNRVALPASFVAIVFAASPTLVHAAWPSDPKVNVPLCTATGSELGQCIVSDGVGGAIVAWSDGRTPANSGDIYVQRVSASGAALWSANGVPICAVGGSQGSPTIVSDGAGGAIIAWVDSRASAVTGTDIYAQRVNAAGAPQWTLNGLAVCAAAAAQNTPASVSDGEGGIIVTWMDQRASLGSRDIYAQRLNASGVLLL